MIGHTLKENKVPDTFNSLTKLWCYIFGVKIMSKRKIASVCIMLLSLFVAIIWLSVAVIRVKYSHQDLMQFIRQTEKYSPDTREELFNCFEKSRLDHIQSIKPLLKIPWRSDIRLYYRTLSGRNFDDHAIKYSPNEWNVKIFN